MPDQMDISVFYITFRAQEALEIQTNQLCVILLGASVQLYFMNSKLLNLTLWFLFWNTYKKNRYSEIASIDLLKTNVENSTKYNTWYYFEERNVLQWLDGGFPLH